MHSRGRERIYKVEQQAKMLSDRHSDSPLFCLPIRIFGFPIKGPVAVWRWAISLGEGELIANEVGSARLPCVEWNMNIFHFPVSTSKPRDLLSKNTKTRSIWELGGGH